MAGYSYRQNHFHGVWPACNHRQRRQFRSAGRTLVWSSGGKRRQGLYPEAVVVGGEMARAWSLVESALTETIEHSVRRGLPSARILPSTLGEKPTLRGALSLVLASKFAAAFAA